MCLEKQFASVIVIASGGQLDCTLRSFCLHVSLCHDCRADQVPVVFSRSFLRCFSNNLISHKAYLHSSAQRIAQRIIVFAGKARAIPGMQVLPPFPGIANIILCS